MRQGLCNDTVSVRPSVCPSQLSTAGLLLSAVRATAAGAYQQQQQRRRSTGCSTALRSKLRAASRLQRTSEAEHGQSEIKSQLGLMLQRCRHVDSAKRRARLGRPLRVLAAYVLLSLNLYHLLSNQTAWNIFPRASRCTIHFRTVTPRSAEVWAYDSSWV